MLSCIVPSDWVKSCCCFLCVQVACRCACTRKGKHTRHGLGNLDGCRHTDERTSTTFSSYTALGPPAASNPDLRPCRARCGAVFPRSSPLLDPRDVPLHALAPERELASLDNLPATTTPPFQSRSPPFAWILSKSLRRRWTTWRDRTTPCQRARSLPRAWPSSVRVLYTGSVP